MAYLLVGVSMVSGRIVMTLPCMPSFFSAFSARLVARQCTPAFARAQAIISGCGSLQTAAAPVKTTSPLGERYLVARWAASKLGQRLTSFIMRTFCRQSSSLILPPVHPPAVTNMASYFRFAFLIWSSARRLLSATDVSLWRRMLRLACWWGRKSTLTTLQGEKRESTLEPSWPLPPRKSTFFILITKPRLYYMMAQQQDENEFITEQQQQRQYLIDLLSQKRKRNAREVAHWAAWSVMQKVTTRIQSGIFKIQKRQTKVEDLLERKELTESMKRLLSNQKRMEEKARQNQLLYSKDKTSHPNQYPPNILSPERHKEFVREIRLQRQRRESKLSELKQKQAVKKQRSFTELKQAQQSQRLALIERRKAQIQQNLQKMRENHEKLLLDESETKQLVNSIRNKKRLHEQLKESYEMKFVLPQIEENKKILEERKENSKLNLEEIQNHEKEYLEWKKSQESLEKSSVSKTSYRPPPHTKKIMKILAEQEKSKHTLQQQKQAIRQKIERVNHYTSLLKERKLTQTPKISKTVATTDREKSQKTEISHETNNRTNLGNKYLQQARKALRKRAKTEQAVPSPQTQKKRPTHARNKTTSFNTIQPKRVQPIHRSKKEEIERMLDCANLTPQQKLIRIREADELVSLQLRKKEERLRVRFSRKDDQTTVELLLAAVRAKMSLLNCYEAAPS